MTFTKLEKNDLEFLNNVRNTTAKDYLHDSRTFTLEETISWFEKTKPDFWIIWEDNERIGYFRLSNYSETNKNIYIGADIQGNYRGKGLGYKSYIKFMPKLFEDLHKISLEVLSTNENAIKLYEKLGFIKEGTKRDEILKNGKWVDSIIMSIKKDEFYENL
jgi:RimJ/RimL family protein N-acetyltransferase